MAQISHCTGVSRGASIGVSSKSSAGGSHWQSGSQTADGRGQRSPPARVVYEKPMLSPSSFTVLHYAAASPSVDRPGTRGRPDDRHAGRARARRQRRRAAGRHRHRETNGDRPRSGRRSPTREGRYRLPALPPGAYEIRARARRLPAARAQRRHADDRADRGRRSDDDGRRRRRGRDGRRRRVAGQHAHAASSAISWTRARSRSCR